MLPPATAPGTATSLFCPTSHCRVADGFGFGFGFAAGPSVSAGGAVPANAPTGGGGSTGVGEVVADPPALLAAAAEDIAGVARGAVL